MTVAYKDVPPDGPPPRLSQEYVGSGEKLVAEQLERAGIRLATTLNLCFNARS